jgi:PAS domain S-box-containing protein
MEVKMKVLLVDDNALSRKLIRQTLEIKGCEVLEAADGEEGVEMARVHGPDLIISDAFMPKMDGFNFLRTLRKEPGLKNIPFVFYSGVYTGQKDEELALSLGASAYIIKPKDPAELWSEISTILKRREHGEKIFMPVPIDTEEDYLKHYSEVVSLKIEEELRELEKANAEIREKAKNYQDLFNSIRDVIVVTRFDGVIVDVNSPTLWEVFGYGREEVVGKNIGMLYPHEREGKTSESAAPASIPDGMTLREITFRKRSGELFCGEICAMQRCDEQGTPTADIFMIRDISERKQAEELLRVSEERRIHLQAELALAAEVQAKLLPRYFPSVPGFAIVARCLPARQVGGDFYDWQEVAPGVLNLTLGDVMGNGMAAAMLMATVRAVIRAETLMSRPAKALQRASRALMSDLENAESLVTLFHARLDTATRKLIYVDCGHGLVFLRRANGAVEELQVRGLPLGVSTDETYREGVIAFNKGDTLVLYSDGLVEALPELSHNNRALAGLLKCTWDAMEMVNRLAALTELNSPPADDLTMLLVHCND